MGKTHPHITSPTPEQLRHLLEGRPEPLVEVYLALHEIVIGELPDLVYSADEVDAATGYGAHQYGYNGWGLAALTPFSKWVSLTFLHGAQLQDPAGLLTGTAQMRHVKLKSPRKVAECDEAVRQLLRAASRLHSDTGA